MRRDGQGVLSLIGLDSVREGEEIWVPFKQGMFQANKIKRSHRSISRPISIPSKRFLAPVRKTVGHDLGLIGGEYR
eukprot:scaffold396323_cov32-Prasinocladus_malaysianus.AAC.1